MKDHKTLFVMISVLSWCAVHCLQEKLLFSTATKLKEIDLDTGVVKELASHSTMVYSIAYDKKEGYVYVPRISENVIDRFPYPNDQNVKFESVVSTYSPYHIAVDSGNSQLYWTELATSGKIMRCNSDGSDLTNILNVTYPMALALDIQNRWIYYNDNEGQALYRLTFDGKEHQIVKNMTSQLIGILVDYIDKRLYLMEYQTGDLKSSLYNGSDVKTVVKTNVISNNREIDIGGEYIFYTSLNDILKIHKSSGQIQSEVHTEQTQIFGLLFYKQEDFVDHRVYWMEYDTGDLKSVLNNGSDVKTVMSTHVKLYNREIDIGGDYIYYTSYKNILKVHKSSGQMPTVVHTEQVQIDGLLFYKLKVLCRLNKHFFIYVLKPQREKYKFRNACWDFLFDDNKSTIRRQGRNEDGSWKGTNTAYIIAA